MDGFLGALMTHWTTHYQNSRAGKRGDELHCSWSLALSLVLLLCSGILALVVLWFVSLLFNSPLHSLCLCPFHFPVGSVSDCRPYNPTSSPAASPLINLFLSSAFCLPPSPELESLFFVCLFSGELPSNTNNSSNNSFDDGVLSFQDVSFILSLVSTEIKRMLCFGVCDCPLALISSSIACCCRVILHFVST